MLDFHGWSSVRAWGKSGSANQGAHLLTERADVGLHGRWVDVVRHKRGEGGAEPQQVGVCPL